MKRLVCQILETIIDLRLLMRLSAFLESLRRTRFMSAEANPSSMVARAGGKEHGKEHDGRQRHPGIVDGLREAACVLEWKVRVRVRVRIRARARVRVRVRVRVRPRVCSSGRSIPP